MTGIAADGQQLIDVALDAFRRDDTAESAEAAQRALELGRARGDAALEVQALVAQARLALRELDFPRLEALCTEAQAAAARTDDPAASVMPLHMRAEAARLQGKGAEAR